MFQDQFRALRKQKGYTQEALAIQLHVVRQTVSKWEKGLSVPDADMLQRIAEVLEVDVSQLLGGALPREAPDRDEVAEQLARINEQLAVRNRRSRRVWRALIVALAVLILVPVLLSCLSVLGGVRSREVSLPAGRVAWSCVLDAERYDCEIAYDDRYRILSTDMDIWLDENAGLNGLTDARQFADRLEGFFAQSGGEATVMESEGLPLGEG